MTQDLLWLQQTRFDGKPPLAHLWGLLKTHYATTYPEHAKEYVIQCRKGVVEMRLWLKPLNESTVKCKRCLRIESKLNSDKPA